MNMKGICETCLKDPTSHSFSKLCEKDKVSIFYTKPSEAKKYNDIDGILKHMDNMLTKHVSYKWAWIFDAEGFEQKHLMELTLTKSIIQLINEKYSSNLEYIHIKNSNSLIKQLFNLLGPILGGVSFVGKIKFD